MNSQLVTVFADREYAYDAAKTLRTDGFQQIWIGVILADASLKSERASSAAKAERRITAELDGCSLTQTLRRHGVTTSEAERVENLLEADDVILTVDGSNHPELAARIVENCDGKVLSGEPFIFTTIQWTTNANRRLSELLDYADPMEFARRKRVDNDVLARLRDDRLLSEVATIREDIFVISPRA